MADYPLVRNDQCIIDLARLYELNIQWKKIRKERERVKSLIDSTIKVCNLYKDESLSEKTKRLRNEIRLMTRGTVTTYEQDAATNNLYLASENEQLYNAESVLLKSAYRKLAMLTHPDKGGDPDIFKSVRDAYVGRDLIFLQELFISLQYSQDLFWQQSKGFAYALQEQQRPHMNLAKFKNNPMFAVNRLHTTGKKADAEVAMRKFQKVLIQTLFNELTYLKEKYYGYQEIEEGQESFQAGRGDSSKEG